jgi:hypothetical protein
MWFMNKPIYKSKGITGNCPIAEEVARKIRNNEEV